MTVIIIYCDIYVLYKVINLFKESEDTLANMSQRQSSVSTRGKVKKNSVAFVRFALIPVIFAILHIPGSTLRLTQALDITLSDQLSRNLTNAQAFCDPAHGTINVIIWIFSDKDVMSAWYWFIISLFLSEEDIYRMKERQSLQLKLPRPNIPNKDIPTRMTFANRIFTLINGMSQNSTASTSSCASKNSNFHMSIVEMKNNNIYAVNTTTMNSVSVNSEEEDDDDDDYNDIVVPNNVENPIGFTPTKDDDGIRLRDAASFSF